MDLIFSLSYSAFLDLQLSFPLCGLSLENEESMISNISQDYRDYIKTFGGNQVWQESWPDCIVSSQPFRLWQCQVSELPCSSSQTFQAVLILWTFPLGDWMLQVLLSHVTQFGCPSCKLSWQLPYGPASYAAIQWRVATGLPDFVPAKHFILQCVQQAIFQHQQFTPPFSPVSTVNCWQVSKGFFWSKRHQPLQGAKQLALWKKQVFNTTAVHLLSWWEDVPFGSVFIGLFRVWSRKLFASSLNLSVKRTGFFMFNEN